MVLDRISRVLILAAEHLEKGEVDYNHPCRAIWEALGRPKECSKGDKEYYMAAGRLHDACGYDFMDHSVEENIADLVAAAYWRA